MKDLYSSYKDLPLSIYQIQTKYRDEARPRAGLLRGREFIMKDSYSFDVDDAGLEVLPEAPRRLHPDLRPARLRVRHRLRHVGRDGRLGPRSSWPRPRTARTPTCAAARCDYAANVEAVRVPTPAPSAYDDVAGRARRADARHPDHRDAGRPPQRTRSRARTGPGTRPTRSRTSSWCCGTRTASASRSPIGVPGDREVDLKRLDAQVYPAEIEAFDEKDFAAHPMLAKGYIGPGVLGEKNESGIRYLVDPRVVEGTRWVTGADVDGRHVIDLVAGRDFTADGTIEAAEVREGDPCPNGDGTLHTARGIEIGHIFALGRKFADALDLKVLDVNGKLVTVTMGSYGIGASRAVAAVAEGTLDEVGLSWPREVAPADVHLVAAGKDEHVLATAERIAHELSAAGIDVLFDDRLGKVSPGVKLKDAELIGVPTIVVVGKDLATDGSIEVKDRASGGSEQVAGRPRRRPRREARACLRASTPSSSTGAAPSPAGTTSTSTRSRSRSRRRW